MANKFEFRRRHWNLSVTRDLCFDKENDVGENLTNKL